MAEDTCRVYHDLSYKYSRYSTKPSAATRPGLVFVAPCLPDHPVTVDPPGRGAGQAHG
jgi:hypothetical protein